MERKRSKLKSASLLQPCVTEKRKKCFKNLEYVNMCLLFIVESGFNLHTSSKYEHVPVNVYHVLYRPRVMVKIIRCALLSQEIF